MKRNYLGMTLAALLLIVLVRHSFAMTATAVQLSNVGQNIGFSAPVTEQEHQWLEGKKVVRLGVSSPNFPPFTITTAKNELEGISADNLYGLQKKLGIHFDILRFDNRARAFDALRRGEIDLVDAVTPAEAREYGSGLTAEYTYTRVALYSKTGSLLSLDLKNLASVIATTKDGFVSDLAFSKFRNTTIKSYQSPYEAIAAVLDGSAEAYLGDTVSTSYLINQTFNNQLVTNLTVENTDTPISFGVMPSNHVLETIISRQLRTRSRCQKVDMVNWWVSTLKCYNGEFLHLLSDEEKALLSRNTTFKIAVSEDLAPYALFDTSGQFGGSMSDFLELVRLSSGLNFEVIRTRSVHDAQVLLDNGSAQLSILSETRSRDKKYLFTQPIITTPYTVITRTSDYDNFDLSDSNLKTIALPRSDALEEFIKQRYPNLNLISTDNIADALNMVRDAKADYTVTSANQARYYLSYKYENTLKTSGVLPGVNALIGVAGTMDNPQLISIIEKALMKISPNEAAVIAGRWRANAATDNMYWEGLSLRVYQGLSVLFVLLLATCIWIVYLRKIIFKKSTTRKVLQDRLSLVQNIVNSIPQPIYVRDREGQLLLFNTAYAQSISANATHNTHARLLDSLLNQPTLALWQQDYAHVVATGEAVAKDQQWVLDDLALDIYHWIQPLRDDRKHIIGVVCGWLDISDRSRMLEQLRQAKADADKANSAKTVFLATMSHEIRTPMNAMIGMLELALTPDRSPEKNRESIQIAHESSLSLLQLLGGILDISSIEAGQTQLHLQATHLKDIVDSVVDVFQVSAEKKGLWINTQFDDYALHVAGFDRLKVKQVLTNLISNAIKFTESGGLIIRVAGKALEKGSFEFVISVQDTGRGIPPSEMATLFIPFSQVNISQNSGAGLGLSIAQSLSRIMGGDLQVDSVLGSGTTMTFKGIAVDASLVLATPSTLHAPASTTRRLNILIVDDHVPSLKLLQEQIQLLGHLPLIAHDGLEALFKWEDHEVDMVITDCNMPELDGIGLTEEIRKLEQQFKSKPCTIIGVTASARAEDMRAYLKAGMNVCLLKPVSLPLLRQHIPVLATTGQPEGYLGDISDSAQQAIMAELVISNRKDLLTLQACLTAFDLEGMANTAHKLKGSARLMQSDVLWNHCQALEYALSGQPEPAELERLVIELRTALEITP